MNQLASWLSVYKRWAWSAIVLGGLLVAAIVGNADSQWRAQQRLSLTQSEAMRSSVEVLSGTLNGNVIGSIALLGLIDMDIKQDAQYGLLSINAAIGSTLTAVGASYDADSVFVVANDGRVKTSWSRTGKYFTGLDVRDFPFYQMALRGKTSVVATMGKDRSERSLYYAAPINGERARTNSGVGAVVVRTSLDSLDKLLQGHADVALLLSPQGLVLAGNRPEWIGRMEGVATPQRLKALRERKQLGTLVATAAPARLPFDAKDGIQTVDGVQYAVAMADVDWHDPDGPWKLLVMEDLSASAPLGYSAASAGATAALFWLLSWMVMHLFQGRYAQMLASAELQKLAREQERQLAFRTQLGQVMVRLQQSPSIDSLCSAFLSDAHVLFGALQGVVYTRSSEDSAGFVLQASYASDGEIATKLQEGEGLLGQRAIDRMVQVLDAAGEGFWTIRSGLGETAPGTLVLAPVIRNDQVLGLVEIALMGTPQSFAQDSFEELLHLLALNLQILLRTQQTHRLLEHAQTIRQVSADQSHLQQTLIDTIPYPVFYKGADARMLGFNRAYEQAFGAKRSDLIGKSVMDLHQLPLADRQARFEEDQRTIASMGPVCKSMSVGLADGTVRNMLYYLVGFRAADGSPGGLVGTFTDLDGPAQTSAPSAADWPTEQAA